MKKKNKPIKIDLDELEEFDIEEVIKETKEKLEKIDKSKHAVFHERKR